MCVRFSFLIVTKKVVFPVNGMFRSTRKPARELGLPRRRIRNKESVTTELS
jgi:hypothetical protein